MVPQRTTVAQLMTSEAKKLLNYVSSAEINFRTGFCDSIESSWVFFSIKGIDLCREKINRLLSHPQYIILIRNNNKTTPKRPRKEIIFSFDGD